MLAVPCDIGVGSAHDVQVIAVVSHVTQLVSQALHIPEPAAGQESTQSKLCRTFGSVHDVQVVDVPEHVAHLVSHVLRAPEPLSKVPSGQKSTQPEL